MTLSTALGLLAGIMTTLSLLPQVLQTIKTRNTQGISLVMYITFLLGTCLWLLYGVTLHSLPMILSNAISMTLAAVVLFLKLKHG